MQEGEQLVQATLPFALQVQPLELDDEDPLEEPPDEELDDEEPPEEDEELTEHINLSGSQS